MCWTIGSGMCGQPAVYDLVWSEPPEQAEERGAAPGVAPLGVGRTELLGAEAAAGAEGQEVGQTATPLVPELVEQQVERVAADERAAGPQRPVEPGYRRHKLPAV